MAKKWRIITVAVVVFLAVDFLGMEIWNRMTDAQPRSDYAIVADTDQRAAEERMQEYYGVAFTRESYDEQTRCLTLRDENGLECHVWRHLTDFNQPENTMLERFCDDYYAVIVGELPQMQTLRSSRHASLQNSAGDPDAVYAKWVIDCDNYDDLADIYRESCDAVSDAPWLLHGQSEYWNSVLPVLELRERGTGQRLALIELRPEISAEQLAEAEERFIRAYYDSGRRSALPDAAILRCPQDGAYTVSAGDGTFDLPLKWFDGDYHLALSYVTDSWYNYPPAWEKLLRKLGWEGDIPEGVGGGGVGTTVSVKELQDRFGVVLHIDPLAMTGEAVRL